MAYQFRDSNEAVGELPLLIGLVGPSGGGKTYSMLRVATGIQKVRGGKIVGIDSEANRMLHYRTKFNFRHLEFKPPFGSLNYLEAIKAAVAEADGGVVMVDSMSHEHEGEDGYLELHEKEVERMSGGDPKKAERVKISGWIKPAANRRKLINFLVQQKCAFIFGFRAKEKIKPVAGGQPIQLGWQPIAGDEFSFEMTVRCLLPPGVNGIPDWSDEAFKYLTAKREAQHIPLIPDGQQLNEDVGERFALWARGEAIPVASEELKAVARTKAGQGKMALNEYWKSLSQKDKGLLTPIRPELQTLSNEAQKKLDVTAQTNAPTPAPQSSTAQMPVDEI